jgi:protein-tyrosine phosphatase
VPTSFQLVEFAVSSVKRTLSGLVSRLSDEENPNFSKIQDVSGEGSASLVLGSIPNKLAGDDGDIRYLIREYNIGYVISVNQQFELENYGPSNPYTTEELNNLHIERMWIEAIDHQQLTPDQMDQIANKIHEQLQIGKSVFIHCRAGVGRSAMGVAAYLIKYKNFSVVDAQQTILDSRPQSTIMKKTKGLEAYSAFISKSTQE